MGEGALTVDDESFVIERTREEWLAIKLAQERQEFIDRAASAQHRDERHSDNVAADFAFDYAEALWAERERRRGK